MQHGVGVTSTSQSKQSGLFFLPKEITPKSTFPSNHSRFYLAHRLSAQSQQVLSVSKRRHFSLIPEVLGTRAWHQMLDFPCAFPPLSGILVPMLRTEHVPYVFPPALLQREDRELAPKPCDDSKLDCHLASLLTEGRTCHSTVLVGPWLSYCLVTSQRGPDLRPG